VVEIIRKGALPAPNEVPAALRAAAEAAAGITLREPRPVGFPLLFTADLQLIEPANAFLHEHAIQRAHTAETVRTYMEILYDWFGALEQRRIRWSEADAVDLVAYRNRMLTQPSTHTGRPYSVRTINHRVRGVLRFYEWAARNDWLQDSALIGRANDFTLARRAHSRRPQQARSADRNIFLIRQFEALPRPLSSAQACELLAQLAPPYDLLARWQLYTGLRVSEVLRLHVKDVVKDPAAPDGDSRVIDVLRKGRKKGYVIASSSLLEETAWYMDLQRKSWLTRAARRRRSLEHEVLFISDRGTPVKRNTYQKVMIRASAACGFKVATHTLRATFACMTLARLERLAKKDAEINPLLIVKVLLGHEHIETTDRYLRAIAVDACVLSEVLDSLLAGNP
jgi:integrase/recombinase XerD